MQHRPAKYSTAKIAVNFFQIWLVLEGFWHGIFLIPLENFQCPAFVCIPKLLARKISSNVCCSTSKQEGLKERLQEIVHSTPHVLDVAVYPQSARDKFASQRLPKVFLNL